MRCCEFIVENVAESNELLRLAKHVNDYMIRKIKRSIFSEWPLEFYHGTLIKDMKPPAFKSPHINELINKVRIGLVKVDDVLGVYYPSRKELVVNTLMFDKEHLKQGAPEQVLVHELRHALDDIKSSGNSWTKSQKGLAREEYLALPEEINARFSELLFILAKWNRQKPIPANDLVIIIKTLFKHFDISTVFPEGVNDARYRRLMSRTYAYYMAHKDEPQQPKNFVQKAKDWILGKFK